MHSLFKYFSSGRNAQKDTDNLSEILDSFQQGILDVDNILLDYIIDCARIYTNKRSIVLLCCHIISNLALDEHHASYMVTNHIMVHLNTIMIVHNQRHKVVWKCSSAIWNLCRPNDISMYIPDSTIESVLLALQNCCDNPKSTHTSLGALSNLALCKPDIFAQTFTEAKMEQLLKIVWRYKTSALINGHFGALVANMSVIGDIAFRCVKLGYVNVLIHCLNFITEEDGIKHVTAALHNLSDVKKFPTYLCDCRGVEVLREIQEKHPEGEISTFIDGIFELAELPGSAVTSLHVAAARCHLTTVLTLLKRNMDIETPDIQGYTAVDIALSHQNGEVVQFLIASGAQFNEQKFENNTTLTTNDKESMLRYVQKGSVIRARSIRKMNTTLLKYTPGLCEDLCNLVTSSVPGVDLLLVLQ